MNRPVWYKIELVLMLLLASICTAGSIVLYFLDVGSKEYILAGFGLVILTFPLVSIARHGKKLGRGVGNIFYLLLLALTGIYFVFIIMLGDFLVIAVEVLVGMTFWSVNLYSYERTREKVKIASKHLIRVTVILMVILCTIFYVNNPAIALQKNILPVPESLFDILIGISVICLLVVTYKVADYRGAVGFMAVILFLWYIDVNTAWVLRNFERAQYLFLGTYIFDAITNLLLFSLTGLCLGRFLHESAQLRRAHQSVFWGPWFAKFSDIKHVIRLDATQRAKIKGGLMMTGLLLGIAVPGILAAANAYWVPITIIPQDYQVKFNFFASPSINTSYTPTEKAEMNKHQVNLDIAMHMDGGNVALLKDFETQMPNITYRIFITPSNISELYNEIVRVTELMRECEINGTLHQWKGFAFDIEGGAYAWYDCYDSPDGSTAMWNKVFDYIDQQSIARNKTIEMECVNAISFAIDGVFDGDYDMQFLEGYNCYFPERFSLYAPTTYRCWPTELPKAPWEYWQTSYYVYSSLQVLQAGVPKEKTGVYLGITNTSCYSRDVPQDDPATWGDGTGLGNLERDVLIVKHFGIKEVTFFLQFDTYDGGWFGGTFHSYGNSFLDDLNYSVNTNPPTEFQIYYSAYDSNMLEELGKDYLCGFSQGSGLLMIGELAGLVGIIYLLLVRSHR